MKPLTFWLLVALLAVSLVIQARTQDAEAAGADNTKIVDGNTQFHRLYVVGNGDNFLQDESFQNDLSEVKGAFEAAGRQAAGSTSRTRKTPTVAGLRQDFKDVGADAGAGDEITIYFKGHGGGTQKYGIKDNAEANEVDHYDEHFRLNATESLYDDKSASGATTLPSLGNMLANAGIPGAGETLVVIVDACYGGGFTGGAGDLAETKDIKVIGASGSVPIDAPKPLSYARDTLSEDIATKANQGGTITGDQLKEHLTGEGWTLGQPSGSEQNKKGKGACAPCSDTGCGTGEITPSIVAQPDNGVPGFPSKITGQNFGPNDFVFVEDFGPTNFRVPLGQFQANPQGTFNGQVSIPGPAGPHLVSAMSSQGYDDWVPVTVSGGVGGVVELAGTRSSNSGPEDPRGRAEWFPAAAIAAAIFAGMVVALGSWHKRRGRASSR